MCAVMPAEILRFMLEYPIVITKHGEYGQLICVAQFGVDPRRNLFWRDGRWISFVVPLNFGRQPFFIGIGEKGQGDAVIQSPLNCIDLVNPRAY